ncbi:hypothetical protein ACH9EU_07750 [Kocuria sp. M1R5S2]|uniref:hypothetical protein n=1 Tax=Kocuria rhizosphaerae TaxID=3376285 RepID=UPI003797A536
MTAAPAPPTAGRYRHELFALVVGVNRWVYRVLAHMLLLRHEYPPFRLDQGPVDPRAPSGHGSPGGPGVGSRPGTGPSGGRSGTTRRSIMNANRKHAVRWQDLSPGRRTALLALASVEISLAATAWADLARRPASEVNGSKAKWAAVIAVNFVGPVLYFRRGRRRTDRRPAGRA